MLFRSWTAGYHGRPQGVLAQPWPHRPHPWVQVPVCPGQDLVPSTQLTPVAEGQPPLLACLDVGHPQVTVVDEGEEGGVGRADFRVHPGPRTLGLDFEWLHGGHLGTERPGLGGQDPGHPATRPQPGIRSHHEAVLAPVPTVEEAVAGLEEEEAALAVEVVGGDAEHA